MRGLVLSHPAVAAVLKPFIVTWWEGPDDQIPAEVLELERYAPPFERRSNVTAFVIAPDGTVVLGTAPHPGRLPFEGDPGPWFAEQVQQALAQMRLPPQRPRAGAGLKRATPTLTPPGAVRALIRITGDMNVSAPLAESTPMTAAAWSSLKWPAAPRTVDAALAAPWLAAVYPPAMMDQESRVSRIAGTLSLAAEPGGRRAVLSGQVQITLPAAQVFRTQRFRDPRRGQSDYTFPATVNVVLTYPASGDLPVDIQGLVRAEYRRQQVVGRLEAVIEASP